MEVTTQLIHLLPGVNHHNLEESDLTSHLIAETTAWLKRPPIICLFSLAMQLKAK